MSDLSGQIDSKEVKEFNNELRNIERYFKKI